ncbi:MAG: alpha/beta hydrolase [Chloroflexota bacterium]
MKSSEWTWKSSDGLEMYARSWEPEKPARAVIALVHGLGEHIGRYEHVGAALTEAGFSLTGYDLRGHGKSGGARGHTPSYDALMTDVDMFLDLAAGRYPGQPRFLYGHSMGGNLVINFALRRTAELEGVIATGPWLKLSFEPPASKVALGKMMNNLFPGFTQASGLDTKALSRDAGVVQAYENDPLVHDKISARLFVEMYQTGLWALERAGEFPLPMLLMHGGADSITSPEASRQFAASAGDKVTLRIWDGLFHEIHNEAQKAEVFATMTEWLDARLKTK